MKTFTLKTDGGARNNPGPAGIGVVLEKDGQVIKTLKRSIGETTNNIAEYQALVAGLQLAKTHGAEKLTVQMDSELIVNQMKQHYKVKDPELGQWFIKAWNLVQLFDKVEFRHIPREMNSLADRLVNEAIDGAVGRAY